MIRPAQRTDLGSIMALEQEAFEPTQRWSEPSWLGELTQPNHRVFVSINPDVDGVVCGHIVANVADLNRITVANRSRRNGIGRELLAAFCDWALGAGAAKIMLEVACDNVAAGELYRSYGFINVGLRANYYGCGIDACVMQLALEVSAPSSSCALRLRAVSQDRYTGLRPAPGQREV
ncbi:MAG: GNAT family N-acetyltransferase [Propionibacteriaceae bacterium]|nr:GNAT family N-acetyltransferase [Propionibacteriaceae bacterium]